MRVEGITSTGEEAERAAAVIAMADSLIVSDMNIRHDNYFITHTFIVYYYRWRERARSVPR